MMRSPQALTETRSEARSKAFVPKAMRVIVSLDMDDIDTMKDFVTKMGDDVPFYKVGLRLFMKYHFQAVDFLQKKDKRIFLDLKLGDIGETVRHAIDNIPIDKKIDFLTVNGSPSVMPYALEALKNRKTQCLFVTRLSSDGDMDDATLLKRGAEAVQLGAQAFVASGTVVSQLRARHPNCCIVTPGVRAASHARDDHKHSLTPQEARAAGANYVVVGRPIICASDSRAAFRQFVNDFS